MENFKWSEFSKKIAVKAALSTVYNAWVKADEITKWFLSRCYYIDASGEKVPSGNAVESGHNYSWHWYAFEEGEQGKILAANGLDYLSFTFAGSCKTEVFLSSFAGQTLVEVKQSNIPIDNNSKRNIRLGCAFGWTFYLINLKSILEGGIDLRNKDLKLRNVVNN